MTDPAAIVVKPAEPTLDDRIAAIDALAVADRIGRLSLRGAMAASSIEIVALARRLIRLERCAAATFNMLVALDRLHDDPKAATAAQQRETVNALLDEVTGTLTALGYAADQDQSQDHSQQNSTGEAQ